MGIHDGHRARKKDQYRRYGLSSMPDHEALELLLYYAIPRRDTNELAHRLLDRFGSLEGVFAAPIECLCRVEGMGESSAMLLRLVHDISRRSASPKIPKHFNTVKQWGDLARQLLSGEEKEVLYQFCIDNKGTLAGTYVLSRGCVDSATADVRLVMENAALSGCTSVVLAHNHPGGLALPSRADRDTTLHLRDSLAVVGIRLVDHIIVAGNDYVSMGLSNYLPKGELHV